MAKLKEKSKNSGNKQLLLLDTEGRNRHSAELDTMSSIDIAVLMNKQDMKVPYAMRRVLPNIARAIDSVVKSIERGGRLFYVGAGTSGRLGALDASECPPTFSTPPEMVQYIIAGGHSALDSATEKSEDSIEQGAADMAARHPTRLDTVVGLTASGRTPYTLAALEFASSRGATTVGVTCNRKSEFAQLVDIPIEVNVGPEVLSGSTRLKAGTAQKLVCNMITTGAMAKLGFVYGNLMVNVHLKNEKLFERGIGILMKASGVNREVAEHALRDSELRVPVALVMLKTGMDAKTAEKRLLKEHGNVRKAIASEGAVD